MLDKLISGALQGMAAKGNEASPLMQVIGSLLSNSGPYGGLAGLVQQFQQAGLGQLVGSWISTGQNLPISADQLSKALGAQQVQQMAASAGLDPAQFSGQLAELLPQMIDKLTPNGELPRGGFEDALGMLGSLLKR